MHIPISLIGENTRGTVGTKALVDCAAGGIFMDQNFVRRHNLPTQKLSRPLEVRNVDGTLNKQGTIRRYVEMPTKIHGRIRRIKYYVSGLGRQTLILGLPWLRVANPNIDWDKGTFEWR